MCDSWQILWENVVGYDPSSSHVEVFMNEEKALWAEWKHSDDFDQGSSSKGILPLTLSSAWAMSNVEAGPSGHDLSAEDVEIKDIRFVEAKKDLRWDVAINP